MPPAHKHRLGPLDARRDVAASAVASGKRSSAGVAGCGVSLRSGTGDRLIRFGPGPDDVGPFYAYRGSEEVLGGWRERVFSDITYGEQRARHVRG